MQQSIQSNLKPEQPVHSALASDSPQRFSDTLYEWMNRSPWVAASLAFHLLLFLITSTYRDVIPDEPPPVIVVSPIIPPEELPNDDPPPIELPPVSEPQLEPVEAFAEIEEPQESEAFPSDLAQDSEPLFDSISPLDTELNALLGLGGPTGKQNARLTRKSTGSPPRSGERAVSAGLDWLARHQNPQGYWDSDDFADSCEVESASQAHACAEDGLGRPEWDVGLTGLALLAFLGNGNSTSHGIYRDNVARGIAWLTAQQDSDGLLGDRHAKEFIYNHAIASLALCETYTFTHSPLLKRSAQKAVDFIAVARDPYGVWRYDVPSLGEGDSSITGWMVFALTSTRDAGLQIDTSALQAALTWFDDNTDPGTGRVGYNAPGNASSRVTGVNDHYPAQAGEAMTAVALLCRVFLSTSDSVVQRDDHEDVMRQHAQLLLRKLPKQEPGAGNDMYYWYYGTYAMFQMSSLGAQYWKPWERAMDSAILGSQRQDSCCRGSWDPNGPWGFSGGRVYSTALMTLSLEVFYRYDYVLGSR